MKNLITKSSSKSDSGGSQQEVIIEIGKNSVQNHNHEQDQVDVQQPHFSVSPERLAELVECCGCLKSPDHLCPTIQEIAEALQTDIDSGIIGDAKDLDRRIKTFGSNVLVQDQYSLPKPAGFFILQQLVLKAFKDGTIVLLLCCAALSILIDVKINGPEKAFLDGAIISLAVFVALNFGHIFRFFLKRWIRKTKLEQRREKVVNVVRQGKMQEIPASQLVVGDVVHLGGTGAHHHDHDQVPADGLFIDGQSCKLDDGLGERGATKSCAAGMFSGAKVVEGSCRMLVTSVGENTETRKLMMINNYMEISDDSGSSHERKHMKMMQDSKLQDGIDRMSSRLEKLWLTLTLSVLILQAVRCFGQKSARDDESRNPDPKGLKNTVEEIVTESTKILKKEGGKINGLVSILCILLFATRDGLPLGIFILLFVVSKRMKFLGVNIQKLSACATLGLVTSVCFSQTSDLTMKRPEMAKLWIGLQSMKDVHDQQEVTGQDQVLRKLLESVFCMNYSEGQIDLDSLLYWAQHEVLHVDVAHDEMYRNVEILHNGPVDQLDMKDLSLLVLKRVEETEEILELRWRGAPDCILSRCSDYYRADGTLQALDGEKRAMFHHIVEQNASSNLPSFAFACKKVIRKESSETPKAENEKYHDHDDELQQVDSGLTLIGLVCLKNPYPPKVRQAMEAFRELGVNIKLLVDDTLNIRAARIMAIHSGLILMPEDIMKLSVAEGSDFRGISEQARMDMIDQIRVIANASPADKLLMVQSLRKKADQIVAYVGSCIRDFPTVVKADVGIFMADGNAEKARDYADVIVAGSGANIVTVYNILRLGRYACQGIEKFLELHLVLNFSAFTTNLIFEVVSREVQLSSIQLLWTNLIMEALGAFALAVLMGEMDQLSRTPPALVFGTAGRIITKNMWRNIAIQSVFQVGILMVLGMKGKDIFHVDEKVLKTMIFNSYVMCQVFTLIGLAMKISTKEPTNIWIDKFLIEINLLFLVVVGVIVALQVLLIEIMGVVARWGSLNFKRWWISVGLAALSSSLASAAKRVSDIVLPCN